MVQAFAEPFEARLEEEEVGERGLALAEARAANVMRVLVESGVKSEKIVTSAPAADRTSNRSGELRAIRVNAVAHVAV